MKTYYTVTFYSYNDSFRGRRDDPDMLSKDVYFTEKRAKSSMYSEIVAELQDYFLDREIYSIDEVDEKIRKYFHEVPCDWLESSDKELKILNCYKKDEEALSAIRDVLYAGEYHKVTWDWELEKHDE